MMVLLEALVTLAAFADVQSTAFAMTMHNAKRCVAIAILRAWEHHGLSIEA
jgi:hypothetical protein